MNTKNLFFWHKKYKNVDIIIREVSIEALRGISFGRSLAFGKELHFLFYKWVFSFSFDLHKLPTPKKK